MSIIYDALKKAEDKKMAEEKKQTPPSPKKGPNKIIIIIFFAAILFVLFIKVLPHSKNLKWLSSFPFLKGKNKAAAQSKDKKSSASTASKKETTPEPPLPKKTYSKGTYTLEGIIHGGNTPVAVINGQVLEKGGTIDDVKIIEITPAAVEILNIKTNARSTLTL